MALLIKMSICLYHQVPFSSPNQVFHLKKSPYGLRQASRQRFSTLSIALKSLNYHQCATNHTFFVKLQHYSFTTLLVYVDDVVLTGDNRDGIRSVKDYLHPRFGVKDLGDLKYFLGLEVARSSKGIHLNQRKYALELLEDSGLLASKPSSTPMDGTSWLSKTTSTPLTDISSYQQLVGGLLYLTTTRPNIAFSV